MVVPSWIAIGQHEPAHVVGVVTDQVHATGCDGPAPGTRHRSVAHIASMAAAIASQRVELERRPAARG